MESEEPVPLSPQDKFQLPVHSGDIQRAGIPAPQLVSGPRCCVAQHTQHRLCARLSFPRRVSGWPRSPPGVLGFWPPRTPCLAPCPHRGRSQGPGPGLRTLTTRPRRAQRPIVRAHVGGEAGGEYRLSPNRLVVGGDCGAIHRGPRPLPGHLARPPPRQAPSPSWASSCPELGLSFPGWEKGTE